MTPFIEIAKGEPTDEELAAVIAVLSRLHSIKELPEPTKLSKWGDPISHMRHRLPVGDRAWRLSAWARH